MIQRSPEWYSYRSKRIGASDAPIILGESPWKTAYQLWSEKTGRTTQPDNSDNFAIQRGIRLEPLVRAMVELSLDMDFPDATLTHAEKPYLMASLDGWNALSLTLLEIKVGNRKDHDAICVPPGETFAKDPNMVPRKYFPQLQHQFFVTGAQRGIFASYYVAKGADETRGDLKMVEVFRDDDWLTRYLPVADRFYECLVSGREPLDLKLGF